MYGPLGEEAGGQEHSTQGEERESSRDRAEAAQVVEEELREREPEQRQAADAQRAVLARETDRVDAESNEPKEGAERSVASLEVGLDRGTGDALGELQDCERDGDADRCGTPASQAARTADADGRTLVTTIAAATHITNVERPPPGWALASTSLPGGATRAIAPTVETAATTAAASQSNGSSSCLHAAASAVAVAAQSVKVRASP